jgi:hypothetical protein
MIFWPMILAVTGADPAGPSLKDAIAAVRRAGPDGEGSGAAAKAWRRLAAAGTDDLPALLAGMDGASPLARNWLRTAIDRVLERAAANRRPPTDALDAFLRETKHDPQARRLAYDLLCETDPKAPDRYLPGMLDDPSPDLRRDAVARVLARADKLLAAGNKTEAVWRRRRCWSPAPSSSRSRARTRRSPLALIRPRVRTAGASSGRASRTGRRRSPFRATRASRWC